MKIRCINMPHYVSKDRYMQSIDRIVNKIGSWGCVESIYQIGSISNPGISDIDIMVIFKDRASLTRDVRSELQPEERYLFSHWLYGVHASNFAIAQRYSFFENYRRLYGKQQIINIRDSSDCNVLRIKHQVAIEFILRMYMLLAIQLTYKVIKVRSLLLTAKAVGYDLYYLGIENGRVRDLVSQLNNWRSVWFCRPPEMEEIVEWTLSFFMEIEKLLRVCLADIGFYHVIANRYRATRNLYVFNRQSLSYTHSGIVMPSYLAPLCSKWFRIQNRLNTFHFNVPIHNVEDDRVLKEKMAVENRLVIEGNRYLPCFLPLTSSLRLQVIR